MTDATPTPDRPAESILGPITPIRCTVPGCHWVCHGVPDKYADSRARIVREHLAAEHAPTPESPDRPADQPQAVLRLLEDAESYLSALHGAVGRHDHIGADLTCGGCALRDRITPALAVARQLLGTTTDCPECGNTGACNGGPCPLTAVVDRRSRYAAAIRETDGWVLDDGQHMIDAVMAVADAEQQELRAEMERRTLMLQASRDQVAQLTADPAAPPAPVDRAATLRAGADAVAAHPGPWWDTRDRDAAVALLRRLAGEAAAGAHQTEARIRCAHTDVLYGRCTRYLDDHDGDCQHEHQSAPAVPAAPEETQ